VADAQQLSSDVTGPAPQADEPSPERQMPVEEGASTLVAMLLDNHHGPDFRIEFETGLLAEAGIATRVVAWDRRPEPSGEEPESGAEVVRINVPAPSGGGRRSFLAMLQFGRHVWRRRRELFAGVSLLIVHDVYLLPLGWALARKLGLPFVYDAHEEYARMEADRYSPWFLRLVTGIESRLARSATAIVVPGTSRLRRWNGVVRRQPLVLSNLVGRDQAPNTMEAPEWDLLYVGTVSSVRRPDLLIEVARLRPDLRIGIAGRGRSVGDVEAAANELPNLTYLGWRRDAGALFQRTRAIYYGLDPQHPYSDAACPNTLYHALRNRRPLIFFCGGEMGQLASEFKIGIRCEASAAELERALDEVGKIDDWQFDEAWQAVWERGDTRAFVEAVQAAASRRG
jgi:glycosyltransferase involved in cell wall biosynthesis